MTDTKPRDLIKLLIDALKKECNWIDNPKYDELIAKANIYLAQYELEEPASTMSPSERWAVLSWVEDHIDTNKALRSWRDSTRGGLLMAEVHTVQPGVRARLAQAEPEGPTDNEILALSQWHEVSYTLTNGSVIYPLQEGTDMKDAVLSFTRAVLARWGK
jgi:hypothetical protein